MAAPNESAKSRGAQDRGNKQVNYAGTATFVGLRLIDPFVHYGILSRGYGTALINTVGGSVLPEGPALITNTPFDRLGLSPYRSIIFCMGMGSVLKQSIHMTSIMQERVSVPFGAGVAIFNSTLDYINSLLFVSAQTSASVNGEHFPQTPLIVGSTLYVIGMVLELGSELQRLQWKKKPENKGKVYEGGLFGLSRHINYFGYTVWRTGYALAAGGWTWAIANAAFQTYNFTQVQIPQLGEYLEDRYGEQYHHYEQTVPYKFMPFVW